MQVLFGPWMALRFKLEYKAIKSQQFGMWQMLSVHITLKLSFIPSFKKKKKKGVS